MPDGTCKEKPAKDDEAKKSAPAPQPDVDRVRVLRAPDVRALIDRFRKVDARLGEGFAQNADVCIARVLSDGGSMKDAIADVAVIAEGLDEIVAKQGVAAGIAAVEEMPVDESVAESDMTGAAPAVTAAPVVVPESGGTASVPTGSGELRGWALIDAKVAMVRKWLDSPYRVSATRGVWFFIVGAMIGVGYVLMAQSSNVRSLQESNERWFQRFRWIDRLHQVAEVEEKDGENIYKFKVSESVDSVMLKMEGPGSAQYLMSWGSSLYVCGYQHKGEVQAKPVTPIKGRVYPLFALDCKPLNGSYRYRGGESVVSGRRMTVERNNPLPMGGVQWIDAEKWETAGGTVEAPAKANAPKK